MTKWVRVSDAQTGYHRTTTQNEVDSNSNLRVLKRPALGPGGYPLPAKFNKRKAAPVERTEVITEVAPIEAEEATQ